MKTKHKVRSVLFDFGGVLAEEGFKKGLDAIGERYGVNDFMEIAEELIYSTGYVLGKADEHAYWNAIRARTGIKATDSELREEILTRFVIRDKVLSYVEKLKGAGYTVGILSDQTDWLYEIDSKTPFLYRFDRVFNSFKMGKGKKDPSIFLDVCGELNINPDEALFIDDRPQNIAHAAAMGMRTILYTGLKPFEEEIAPYL